LKLSCEVERSNEALGSDHDTQWFPNSTNSSTQEQIIHNLKVSCEIPTFQTGMRFDAVAPCGFQIQMILPLQEQLITGLKFSREIPKFQTGPRFRSRRPLVSKFKWHHESQTQSKQKIYEALVDLACRVSFFLLYTHIFM